MYYMIAIAIVMLIVSATITYLSIKKPATPQPAVLGDFGVPQIAEGTAQSIVFGDCWVTDWEVLYYGDLRSDAIHAKSGKK